MRRRRLRRRLWRRRTGLRLLMVSFCRPHADAPAVWLGQALIIDDPELAKAEADLPDTALMDAEPDATAYIYYTSGTTGRPKGRRHKTRRQLP